MPRESNAEGYYFHVEARMFEGADDLSGGARAAFLAMLKIAAERDGTGAFKLHISDVIDTVQLFTFDEKPPKQRAVLRALAELEQKKFFKKLGKNYVFIPDFWGYGHNPNNDNHLLGAWKSLVSMPLEVRLAFTARYGAKPDGKRDGVRDGIADGIPDTKGDQQEQEQKQLTPLTPRKRGEPAATDLPSDITEAEQSALAEMRDWRGFSNFNPAKSVQAMRRYAAEFAGVNVCTMVGTVTAWLDEPKNSRQNGGLLRLRRFCQNEHERIRQRTASSYAEPPKPAATDQREDLSLWQRGGKR